MVTFPKTPNTTLPRITRVFSKDASRNCRTSLPGRMWSISPKLKPDKVVFGATVTVYDTATEEESTFKLSPAKTRPTSSRGKYPTPHRWEKP